MGVQPWWLWPYLSPEVGCRLTLVILAFALALLSLGNPSKPLPISLIAVAFAFLAVMAWHTKSLWTGKEPFRFFYETALLSDGALVVLACAIGLWALTQYPLRWVRWVGLCLLIANLIAALTQYLTKSPINGFMGLNRIMGAYAVIWTPILWVWAKPLIVIPLALVALSGKSTAWIGFAVAIGCFLRPAQKVAIGCGSVAAAVYLSPSPILERMEQRMLTWLHSFQASLEHPFSGWSWSPFALNEIREKYGYLLPTVHSDWLGLAVYGGFPLCLIVLWAIAKLFQHPKTDWANALRASFMSAFVMSSIQSVVSNPKIGALMLVFLAWWLREQREELDA